MSETLAERDGAADHRGDLRWESSYDRASVEQFLTEARARCDALRADLAEGRDRAAHARAALEQRAAARSDEMAAMVADVHRQLAALEADHEAAVRSARAAAVEEAERIGADAPAPPDGGDPT